MTVREVVLRGCGFNRNVRGCDHTALFLCECREPKANVHPLQFDSQSYRNKTGTVMSEPQTDKMLENRKF